MSSEKRKLSPEERLLVKHQLWRKGDLSWKCHPVQKEMYDLFYRAESNSVLCWLLARQTGKSYLLAILALETALRNKNGIIKLVTDTKVHVKSIFEPIFRELLDDCPEDLKPSYNTAQYIYTFSNGAQIQLAGSDGKHYEKLRGQKSLLNLVDEAGFCNDLDDMVTSVLIPTTTHTGGKIILSSTPPKEEDHPFHSFLERAEMEGQLIKKTIHDNPLLTKEQIAQIAAKMGGETSERFRREYLCHILKSSDTSVIPEFTAELEEEIVKEHLKPPFFYTYESMDLGFKDLTVILLAYYDFREAKIVIDDELVFDFKQKGVHLEKLVEDLKAKEEKLWTNKMSGEVQYPRIRVSDINYIVTGQISTIAKKLDPINPISFTVASKSDKEAGINQLRIMLASKKIIINPRCVTLIRHLKNVKWKSHNKDEFARSVDNGHYDAVDALLYLIRAVEYNKSPYPSGYGFDLGSLHVQNYNNFNKGDPNTIYKKLFNIKKK